MSSQNDSPNPVRLRGLDPGRLLDLLDEDVMESRPSIHGWRVLGVAGKGGSGIVWRALREADETTAAIKIAPPDEPDTVERIEREAGFLRDLRHPNIVRLLETGSLLEGEEEGGLYLAMEFIDGPPVSHEIPEQGLPPEQAFQWFRQIASAVAHAHECGILHRDLKPSNVLLSPDGTVKVADFGLAKPVHRRVHMLSLTRAGQVAGTAEYLPPEAYRRDYHPSQVADIFALGVMLHEMLTGTPPRGAWQPASSRRGVDIRIDDLIRRAMDPDPQRRWPDAKAMLAELDRILNSSPRYSGTPLVTLPVQVTDCLWTVLGLFILLSATSSLLNLRKAEFSLPLDLVGKHTDLVGGFNALFYLLVASIPLAVWQIIRLRRFHHIPMREALPAPFGVKLGHGRTAAWLVTAFQFFCFLLPLLQMLTIYTDTCLTWHKPDNPPWAHGLAVTTWQNDREMLDPWQFRTSDRIWLYETQGPPGHPFTRYLDRVSFFPGYVPTIMVTAAGLLGLAMLVTLLTASRGWWLRERRLHVITSLALMGVFGTGVGMGHLERFEIVARETDLLRDDNWIRARMTEHIRAFVHQLVEHRAGTTPLPEPSRIEELYAPEVDYRGHGLMARSQIPAILAGEIQLLGEVFQQFIADSSSWKPGCGTFRVSREYVEFHDTADTSGATHLKLTMSGIATPDGHTAIRSEQFEITPLYQAEQRMLEVTEAAAWAAAFDGVFRKATDSGKLAQKTMEELFEEHLMGWEGQSRPRLVRFDEPLQVYVFSLLQEGKLFVNPQGTRVIGREPGGRTRIAIPLHAPRKGGSRDLMVDLVFRDGRWRSVALAF